MIKHDNIIYARDISPIGGVETYVYELAKKYHKYDIAVVCRRIARVQKKRLQKWCKVYEYHNEPIDCKVAIINWDTSIIDYLPKEIWKENLKPGSKEGIYQGIHADYTHPAMGSLPQDPRIKEYLAITEDVLRGFHELSNGKNVRVCRNPYELEKKDKPLVIVSPTRLTKEKGGDLMLRLADELDKQGTEFIWFVLTTDEYLGNPIFMNNNVIWIKNRLDVDKFLSMADWVVLPSQCEGDSYTIREAMYRGIPIVARHLKYFDEYGIKDGENALFIDDLNVEDIAKRMKKRLKFTFEPIEDGYDEILIHGKSHYEQDLEKKVTLKCTYRLGIDLIEEGYHLDYGKTDKFTTDRAEELMKTGVFEEVKNA